MFNGGTERRPVGGGRNSSSEPANDSLTGDVAAVWVTVVPVLIGRQWPAGIILTSAMTMIGRRGAVRVEEW